MYSPSRVGLSKLQKCMAAIQMLAYKLLVDAGNEYVYIDETLALVAMRHWMNAICGRFGYRYLQQPHFQI